MEIAPGLVLEGDIRTRPYYARVHRGTYRGRRARIYLFRPGGSTPIVEPAARSVEHAGLGRLLAAGRLRHEPHAGRSFVAYEEVAGGETVEAWRATPRRPADLVPFARDLALAVSAGHRAGVLHGAIRPDAIVVARAGPVLFELGLLRHVDEVRRESKKVWEDEVDSLSYMAPEVVVDGKHSERSDVWSLGAVMHFVCAGQPPFVAHDMRSLISRIVGEPARQVRAFAPFIPEALEAAIARCLSKKPGERFASAGELARTLS